MKQIDLLKFALRSKVVGMIGMYARKRMLRESGAYWRRLIRPN